MMRGAERGTGQGNLQKPGRKAKTSTTTDFFLETGLKSVFDFGLRTLADSSLTLQYLTAKIVVSCMIPVLGSVGPQENGELGYLHTHATIVQVPWSTRGLVCETRVRFKYFYRLWCKYGACTVRLVSRALTTSCCVS
jgi:hypothetical protein